jgi:N4 Gp49/Sf6 Gp66 family protein
MGTKLTVMTPDYGDREIEQEIRRKNLSAPRLTPDEIDAKITGEQYHVFPGTTLTVCCLELENGFTVTGESAAVSPENFDEEIGRKIARGRAHDKIWALEGYLLREKLHRAADGR